MDIIWALCAFLMMRIRSAHGSLHNFGRALRPFYRFTVKYFVCGMVWRCTRVGAALLASALLISYLPALPSLSDDQQLASILCSIAE